MMGFSNYLRTISENKKILLYRNRYSGTREKVQNLETKTVLNFKNPTPEELKNIRSQIFIDLRKSKRRNNVLLSISVASGLIGLVLIFLLIKYVYF